MRYKDAANLKPGDKVFWTAHRPGLRSREINIEHVVVQGDFVILTDEDGNEVEARAPELSYVH